MERDVQLSKPVTAASRTIIKTGVSAGLTDTGRDKGLGPHLYCPWNLGLPMMATG